MDITVGKVIDILETQIFSNESNNEFEKLCVERENQLKDLVENCMNTLMSLAEMPHKKNKKISLWEKEKTNACMRNISDYLAEVASDIDESKIKTYCNAKVNKSYEVLLSNPHPNILLLIMNSYYGCIESDFYWAAGEVNVYDAIQISLGRYHLVDIDKYIPQKITQIEEGILDLKRLNFYSDQTSQIEESLNCLRHKFNTASYILLFTSIESFVRKLGQFLNEKQELNVNINSRDYNSLDAFLRKIPWKDDIKVEKTDLMRYTGDYKKIEPKSERYEHVNLKVRLDFLRRRFKENRDIALHGEKTKFENSFNIFMNLSAVGEVIKTIKYYHALYN